MKSHFPTLLLLAVLAFGCSEGNKAESDTASANTDAIEACDCLEIYKSGTDEERTQCDELRKDENFQKAFVECRSNRAERSEKLNVQMPTSGRYQIVSEESQLMWTGKNITGYKHVGTIAVKRGFIEFNEDGIASATVVADMTQIDETAMEDGDKESKLIGHLKSDDFFAVDQYPEAKFVFSSSQDLETGQDVVGEFTVRGITQKETAKVILTTSGDDMVVVTGTMIFDRTKYNVRYGSGKFFDDLGDDLIKDSITIKMKLKAKKTAQPS